MNDPIQKIEKFDILIKTLILQSRNVLFHEGKISEGGKVLVKQVVDSIDVDRASIWLYSDDKKSIICQQLYVKSENKYYQDIELLESDYKPYFDALIENAIIVAHDAETHPATSCFLDSYLKPLGIKSMLDVPIIYKNELIGVICIESCTPREWDKIEIHFAQLLSSIYSFSYATKEAKKLNKELDEFNKFIDKAALISRADSSGKITYVNEKFEDISGWKLDEVKGHDHNIVNSGLQPKQFWANMYKTVVTDKDIWNSIVINKAKDGHLYYVDTYIKAEFDNDEKLKGFTSIRQDVSKIYEVLNEIDKKNTYLEHAAKILRHDMHSGINTYIPRGISSLERRLTQEDIKNLKIEAPLKMLKEGLKHTQKVYKGVYEFTNLVKKDSVLTKAEVNIKTILDVYLTSTAYKSQVYLDDNLPTLLVNESLFCTALDNIIRNGLKYNDSPSKIVKVYSEDGYICVEDNGRGMSQQDLDELSKPYVRKEGQKEAGSGLGLNICKAILKEHGFEITAEKLSQGTKLRIKIK